VPGTVLSRRQADRACPCEDRPRGQAPALTLRLRYRLGVRGAPHAPSSTTIMARTLLFACLLLVAAFAAPVQDPTGPPAKDQPAVDESPFVAPTLPVPDSECRTCEGRGRISQKCERCAGSKRSACLTCGSHPNGWLVREIAFFEVADPARAIALEEHLRRLRELHQLRIEVTGDRVADPFDPSPSLGTIDCPGWCTEGRSRLNLGHDCGVCDANGSLECPECAGKCTTPCAVCNGKGRRDVICVECVGTKRSFSPQVEGVVGRDCTWCRGTSLRSCGACSADVPVVATCDTCRGSERQWCDTCKGTKRARCRPCSGTGDLSSFRGATNLECSPCKQKGWVPCMDCDKSGKSPCRACDALGTVDSRCAECLGHRAVLCNGCTRGSIDSWLVTAARLEEVKDFAGVVAQLEGGRAQLAQHTADELEHLALTQSERRERTRQLQLELEALDKRITKARVAHERSGKSD